MVFFDFFSVCGVMLCFLLYVCWSVCCWFVLLMVFCIDFVILFVYMIIWLFIFLVVCFMVCISECLLCKNFFLLVLRIIIRLIFGKLSLLCSRFILISILNFFKCNCWRIFICLMVLMLEWMYWYFILMLLRYFCSFFVMCLVSVVMSVFLLCLMCCCIFLMRLLIWFFVGFILMMGFSNLVGWISCFIMIFFDILSLKLVGVVEMYIIWFSNFWNFLNFSGWLFMVVCKWKLKLMRLILWVWLLLYMVWICGIVMWFLFMISRKLLGK